MKVATGLAIGITAHPDLAAQAVAQAMQMLDVPIANSVLLFLTSEFAAHPQPAIRAAAIQASCMQVMGCSAPGIFTDQDWVLDAPAVAAMVFSGDIGLQATHDNGNPLLTLAAPNAINTNWLATSGPCFGGVSGDAIGQGAFSVWQNAKGALAGHCQATVTGAAVAVAVDHGLRVLSQPQIINEVDGHSLQLIGEQSALASLQQACSEYEHLLFTFLPLHLLMAVYAENRHDLESGNYQLSSLLGSDATPGSVTVSRRLRSGQFMAWAIRDIDAAQVGLTYKADYLTTKLACKPDFGMFFSCMGRGPYFYGGVDKDLELLAKKFPHMPFIGFYGNGELSPVNDSNSLLQHSAVLALFADDAAASLRGS